jgi:hypothetical protein
VHTALLYFDFIFLSRAHATIRMQVVGGDLLMQQAVNEYTCDALTLERSARRGTSSTGACRRTGRQGVIFLAVGPEFTTMGFAAKPCCAFAGLGKHAIGKVRGCPHRGHTSNYHLQLPCHTAHES